MYLNVGGVHNQVSKLSKFQRGGSVIVGYGNLDPNPKNGDDKYIAMREAVDLATGKGVDARLKGLADATIDAMSQKVANERQQKARA